MKRTLTTLALAILMVASIFAASKNTTIELDLKKDPKYTFGITTVAFKESDIVTADASQTEITNTSSIVLKRATSGNTLDVQSTSDCYLSYFFYEYDEVTLTMSIDGNLCNTTAYDTTNADVKAANEIEYTIKGNATGDNTQDKTSENTLKAIDLDSSDSSKLSYEVKYNETNKLGEYRWASIQLTIAPKYTSANGNATLKGKTEGSYKSTITLTVESN